MERKKYPDILTDQKWETLEPLIKQSKGNGGAPQNILVERFLMLFFMF